MTTGTELQIIPPVETAIAEEAAERLPAIHTDARTDGELVAVWLKLHAGSSPHTHRVYTRIGHGFVEALARQNTSLKRATIDQVQTALDAMRTTDKGTPASQATMSTYVAAVKSLHSTLCRYQNDRYAGGLRLAVHGKEHVQRISAMSCC